MTKKEATEAEIEVWRYLAEHPENNFSRTVLPEGLYGNKAGYSHRPLCEYSRLERNNYCMGCPAGFTKDRVRVFCNDARHPYMTWKYAFSKNRRKKAATAIVQLLEAALEKEKRNEKSN
jgi:hypothetical protein